MRLSLGLSNHMSLDCTLEVNTRKWWLGHLLARLGRDQFSDYFSGRGAVCDRFLKIVFRLSRRLKCGLAFEGAIVGEVIATAPDASHAARLSRLVA